VSERDRAIAFLRAHDRALADRVETLPIGEVLLTPSLPRVHDANFVLCGELPAEIGVPELEREAERVMGAAGLDHRRVNADDEATAARLAPEFKARGWDAQQFLVMTLRRAADRPADLSIVTEVDPAALEGMRTESIGRQPWGEQAVIGQILERDRRRVRLTNVRAFAVLVDGRPVSHAFLYRDHSPVAQVEDVETLEECRGRGYARAVVTAAAQAAAGAELVFLVADAFDSPQELYRKLGFDAAGTEDRFLKRSS
jgi:ribosomal protein S18 acetylase RimI-like enzyme